MAKVDVLLPGVFTTLPLIGKHGTKAYLLAANHLMNNTLAMLMEASLTGGESLLL